MNVEAISLDDQFINVLVQYHNCIPWLLTTVYASPNPIFRLDLWEYLTRLGQVVSIPWILIGDFNQILYGDEKKGGNPISCRRLEPFQRMVSSCELIDMGFSGPKFTWTNMRRGIANV